MSSGSSTESYPAFAHIGLRKNLNQSSVKNLKVRIYKTVILPVVLYGCETWTLTLREEQRLNVFEKIFGAKRDEVTGEWRKLHNAELHALYSSPDMIRNIKSRRLRWAGHVARMGKSINAYRVLVGRPEGKRPLGRPRRRWEDNIKMDLREVGYDAENVAYDVDFIQLTVRLADNFLELPLDVLENLNWDTMHSGLNSGFPEYGGNALLVDSSYTSPLKDLESGTCDVTKPAVGNACCNGSIKALTKKRRKGLNKV
ncbi:hypothetical protein ANN_12601 [Periplaneta americana]|uniref:Uncharacterized protein n=1 Tax=Periplaneta americana TaxID=6978 RepID=A0ABQ8TH71_PERAM|nr:hypothetical protein ANN_12601 [Periplaneta americana]